MQLSIDELVEEKAKVDAAAGDSDGGRVVSKLPSFKAQRARGLTRAPSFFNRIFKSTKKIQIHALPEEEEEEEENEDFGNENQEGEEGKQEGEEGEEKDSEGEEEADESRSQDSASQNAEIADRISNMSKVAEVVVVSHSHEEEELLAKQHYVDPPMPLLGKPVDTELLVGRNKKAEFALSQLMTMVMADVDEALGRATTIPVGDQLDRIIVSEEQSAHIGRTSSLTGVRKEVTHNLTTIQKALNYRKSALIMMNHKYVCSTILSPRIVLIVLNYSFHSSHQH
jgi:hypothetical protein